jgi:glycosyltransferase involved in cell wall biosynthesis
MNKILIVGQTPPPYGGQAIMIGEIVKICTPFDEISEVRMAFSEDMNSIGKFKFNKIYELFRVIWSIWYKVLTIKPTVLYYPPTGGYNKIPFYRDFLILFLTRFLFEKTIFHFHAGGINELYNSLSSFQKRLFKIIYDKPDISIILTSNGHQDAQIVNSLSVKVIPYGISDVFANNNNFRSLIKGNKELIRIIFVGVVRESKGVMVLLEACKILVEKNCKFEVDIIGKVESELFQNTLNQYIESNSLDDYINLHGVKTGLDKFNLYCNADIFCFPTFFESETFGVVNLEAMMCSLPIVSTFWRGISEVVVDGENGILCPIKDSAKLAIVLETLINNPKLRIEMGKKGREIFEKKYTLEIFRKNIIETFETL